MIDKDVHYYKKRLEIAINFIQWVVDRWDERGAEIKGRAQATLVEIIGDDCE